jgi:hypothetical protein
VRPKVLAPVAAVAEIVIDAVTLVPVGLPVIDPVMPGLFENTAVAPLRPVPVNVNGVIVVPTVPDEADKPVSVVVPVTVNGKV